MQACHTLAGRLGRRALYVSEPGFSRLGLCLGAFPVIAWANLRKMRGKSMLILAVPTLKPTRQTADFRMKRWPSRDVSVSSTVN